MSWQTFGHRHVKAVLEKQLETGQLAQAYLFLGPEGLGKKLLALELAQKTLEVNQLETHPDFTFFSNGQSDIAVEEVRRLISELSTKPFFGKRKVVVIDNAQNLNASGSNALLKTLEEPGVSTVIILVADRKPLPTIVSRCQVFRFNPLSVAELAAFAKEKKLAAGKELLDLSFGSPARLAKLSADAGFLTAEHEALAKFSELMALSRGERLVKVGEFAAYEPEALAGLFFTWMMHALSRLGENPGLAQAVAGLQEAMWQLRTNKNKKLILQGVFLKI